jgi:hypothetical protein
MIEDDIAQPGNGLTTPQESEIPVDEQPTFSGCLSRGSFAAVHTDYHTTADSAQKVQQGEIGEVFSALVCYDSDADGNT